MLSLVDMAHRVWADCGASTTLRSYGCSTSHSTAGDRLSVRVAAADELLERIGGEVEDRLFALSGLVLLRFGLSSLTDTNRLGLWKFGSAFLVVMIENSVRMMRMVGGW